MKPEFFKHSDLFDAEKDTGLPLRVAYIGLWTCCDREGRFKWRPRELKIDVLPYDEIDFSRVLDALVTRGFIQKYTVAGEQFGVIPTFSDHQYINNKEPSSALPKPPGNQPVDPNDTRELRVGDASSSRGVKEGKGREWEWKEETGVHDITPAMIAKGVIDELMLAGRDLLLNLETVARAELLRGGSADDIRNRMVAAWQKYEIEKPKLEYTKGPAKFFGDGDWRDPKSWPYPKGSRKDPFGNMKFLHSGGKK